MLLKTWQEMNGKQCACGKVHTFGTHMISGKGVLPQLTQAAADLGATKVFVLSDPNTYAAAGKRVCDLLEQAGIPFVSFTLSDSKPEPDERTTGSVFLHWDASCDLIVAVGSGVINDIGKLVSHATGKPYIIVATAPSMDGYASATSSMERDGLKVSVPTRAPDVILGDADILCFSPLKLLRAGLGDMLAKYISLCEWRIAHLLLGEYYCEDIAHLVRSALGRCTQNAEGLLRREEAAVMAVFEGLVLGGIAMNYAGISRPASGVEHYISHVLDMRGAALHTPTELHGLQCAVGTLIAARLYEKLKTLTPDRAQALASVAAFDYEAHKALLHSLVGKGADSMIRQEETEGKYDKATHPARLEKLLDHWDAILAIIGEEVPPAAQLEALLCGVGIPTTLGELGTADDLLPQIFAATRDIRDKYVLSRLCWDLGITEAIW